jgi:hypothetical protein
MSVLIAVMSKERLSETLAFRVTARVYNRTDEIAKGTRREMADVERALYERGLAAYERDGQLFEPEDTSERAEARPGKTIRMEVEEGRRTSKPSRKTGNDKK